MADTGKWQPIETFPEEDVGALLWADELSYWNGEPVGDFRIHVCYYTYVDSSGRHFKSNETVYDEPMSVAPTHWMPLPAPPQ